MFSLPSAGHAVGCGKEEGIRAVDRDWNDGFSNVGPEGRGETSSDVAVLDALDLVEVAALDVRVLDVLVALSCGGIRLDPPLFTKT
jgi:hypothetical protein